VEAAAAEDIRVAALAEEVEVMAAAVVQVVADTGEVPEAVAADIKEAAPAVEAAAVTRTVGKIVQATFTVAFFYFSISTSDASRS
jgi:hypothetical protein